MEHTPRATHAEVRTAVLDGLTDIILVAIHA
ncbi:hypothetical protein SAMN05421678_112117 [Actinopolymorpha cephalotaxi]|uniref:Uncharacterized protein n=1 Tax=Actinopolymorpha cephalotaxi TaxID=504797 RepID=A0A1I2XCI0_9ACTN|nr:hypothetical protein [Actinopolymorpha cephalotaxi]SFH11203.1 hypothetical protein SAMN05421678_112117 [Actinopolymorpha cephalotaxi]